MGGCALAIYLFQGCFLLNTLHNNIGDNQIKIPPLNTNGIGTFQGYYCGYGDSSYPFARPFFLGLDTGGLVTYNEALEACEDMGYLLDTETSVYCTWNDEPIYLRELEPGDCDDARFGGEPGDGSCGVDPELTIVSSYEARGDHSGNDFHPMGNTNVHLDRPGSHVLVLATYEPVNWTVTTGPGVELVQIIASGNYEPIVNAPAGVPIETLSTEIDGDYQLHCPGPFPDQDIYSGCATPIFFDRVEALTGLEITSYYNCYQLTDITINADLSASSSCLASDGIYDASYSSYELTTYIDPDCDINLNPEEPDCGEPYCGDGVLNSELGEECDDGNDVSKDGCDAFCFIEGSCDELPGRK